MKSAAYALFAASLCFALASSAEAQTRYATHIQSTPPGATVFLDSTSGAALGVTPLRSVRIARGQHNFIFRMDGYQETTVAFNVTRYGQTVTATLPQVARVQITAADESAQGATVTIDGERRGTIPYSDVIRPDRVQIVITREGYIPVDQWVTLTGGQVFAWPVTLQRNAPRTGSLAVFADVRGVPVFIDNTQRCTTPCTVDSIAEGPHLVEVRPTQEGARPFTRQVTIVAGQTATVDADLGPQGGSIRVISQTPGALVSVDGEPVGPSPATRDGLSPGDHIVEVTATGYQRVQQSVTVTGGQQRVVSIELTAVAATAGTLRVIGAPRGAIVTVDGAPVGEIPAEAPNLSAGDHIVEVSMQGYVTQTQTVTIVAGQPRVVSVTLAESPRAPGRILVRANVPGATVILDGGDPRPAPYVQDNAPVGTHAIIVRAPGYSEFSQTCEVGPGRDCIVEATMEGARVRLRVNVQTTVRGGVLLIDGSEVGPVPFEGQVGVGPHRLEIRAPNYRTYVEQIQLSDAEPPRVMDVRLVGSEELTPEEIADRERTRERAMRNAFGRTGATLPPDLATVEIIGGWPYLGEVRFNMGLHEMVDIGLGVRNAGRITEFVAHARLGHSFGSRFSLGGEVQIGGGAGPNRTEAGITHKTNAFVTNFDLRASLHINRVAAFTANLGLDITSDRWDYQIDDRDTLISPTPDRQLLARGRIGATLEFALGNHDSLMFSAQAILGQRRRILGDMFGNDSLHYEDKNIGMHAMFQVGWMHKFNWRFEDDL